MTMKHSAYRELPLVHSCSGCSSAAQLANHVALPILAIDGCALHCVKSCLVRHGVALSLHYTLADFGVRKRHHRDFEPSDAEHVLYRIHEDLRTCFEAREDAAAAPHGAAVKG
jgi:uncharacterized metal-binding protein